MPDNTSNSWPPGASEMPRRIREYDWTATALGPIVDWPQSLKTSLDNCLASGFPGFIWWGPELIELHNDAALMILRAKHPAALGQSAKELWTEVWSAVDSLVEHVLTTGEPITAEDMSLEPVRGFGNEVAYFTFCYSALHDESGAIAGVKVVVIETTNDVLTRERLRASEERQAFLLTLHDTLRPLADPAAVQRTAMRMVADRTGALRALYFDVDPDGDRITSTEGFDNAPLVLTRQFRITDFACWMAEAFVAGETIVVENTETDPRIDESGRAAFRALGARAAMGVPLVKDDRLVAVIAINHAEPYAWSKEELRLMEVLAERTWAAVEHAQADTALRASESRLQFALGAADMGTFVWYPRENRGIFDERMLMLFGLESGARLNFFRQLGELIIPEDRSNYSAAVARALDPTGDGILRCELRIVRANDQAKRWIAMMGQTKSAGNPPEGVSLTGVCLDITERKRRESHQQFTIALFRRLGQMTQPEEIEQTAIEIVGAYFGVSRCYIAYVDDNEHLSIQREYRDPRTTTSAISETELRDFVNREAIEQYMLGIPFAIEDVRIDPRSAENAASFAAFEIRSYVSTSIFSRGRLAALFLLSHREPRVWEADEQILLREIATHVFPLIQRARVELELRAREESLQQQISVATTELRMLSRQRLQVQEEERRYLARELHDEIGQSLTGLSLILNPTDSLSPDRLHEARKIVADLTGQIRQLSVDLRPATLDDFGLAPTLSGLLDRFEHRTGIMVELRHEGIERRFPSSVEITAYRIVQEALTNVARHAATDRAIVQLFADETVLTISVQDKGQGFDTTARTAGIGLVGMRERTQLLGGTLTIDTTPGEGVIVFADLPLVDRMNTEEPI